MVRMIHLKQHHQNEDVDLVLEIITVVAEEVDIVEIDHMIEVTNQNPGMVIKKMMMIRMMMMMSTKSGEGGDIMFQRVVVDLDLEIAIVKTEVPNVRDLERVEVVNPPVIDTKSISSLRILIPLKYRWYNFIYFPIFQTFPPPQVAVLLTQPCTQTKYLIGNCQ